MEKLEQYKYFNKKHQTIPGNQCYHRMSENNKTK